MDWWASKEHGIPVDYYQIYWKICEPARGKSLTNPKSSSHITSLGNPPIEPDAEPCQWGPKGTTENLYYFDWNADNYWNTFYVWYKVRAVDTNGGKSGWSDAEYIYQPGCRKTLTPSLGIVQRGGEGSSPPSSLLSVSPNLTFASADIKYSLLMPSKVILTVHDISGKVVKTLVDDNVRAGLHTVNFHGTDEHERTLSSGIYFVRLSTETFTRTAKITLIR